MPTAAHFHGPAMAGQNAAPVAPRAGRVGVDRMAEAAPHSAPRPSPDESNASVAGEEDPGAALDLLDTGAASPAGWCPWPQQRSA
jgi:hypothetical protein